MNIALFGTSADPPTVGHQQILLGLATQFDRVVVWASDNPFKHHGASLNDRAGMLSLVVDEANAVLGSGNASGDLTHSYLTNPHLTNPHLTNPHLTNPHLPNSHLTSPNLLNPLSEDSTRPTCSTCPKIQLRSELSHRQTIVTVEQARKYWPDGKFTLVIGSDLVTQLPQWYRSQDLLSQVKLLVIPRPDFPINDAALEPLRALGTEATIAHWQGLPVSSTAFREAGSITSITPAVHSFIRQNQLYQSLYRPSFYQEARCQDNVHAI